jgi:hypothetical protein
MEIAHEGGYYFAGLSYHYYIHPIVEALKTGESVQNWSTGCIFEQQHIAQAIDLGFLEHHATRINSIAKGIGTGAHAIWVVGKLRQASSDLDVGDFILEIDGESVGRMADIRKLSQAEFTKVLVLHDQEEKEIRVHSISLPFIGTRKVVCWAGALCQRSPGFALEQTTPEFVNAAKKEGITELENLVYVSSCILGSPSSGIPDFDAYQWIVGLNNQKVNSLEEFLGIITTLKVPDENEEYIQVKLLEKQGKISIVGVILNSYFWPSWSLEWTGKEWIRKELE